VVLFLLAGQPLLVVVVFLTLSLIRGDTCICECCIGFACTPTFAGKSSSSPCSSCSDSSCESNFPASCNSGNGKAKAACYSGPSPASAWVGTLQLDGACSQNRCCCLVNTFTLSEVDDTTLALNGPLAGGCGGQSTASFDITGVVSNSWTGRVPPLPDLFDITLNGNSINLVDVTAPACSGSATLQTNGGGSSDGGLGTTIIVVIVVLAGVLTGALIGFVIWRRNRISGAAASQSQQLLPGSQQVQQQV